MKLSRIKIDFAGRACFLGDEVFVWRKKAESLFALDYPSSMFQLISGIRGSQVPGYHTVLGWVTICPLEKNRPAFFMSVKRSDLRKLSSKERKERGIKDEVRRRIKDARCVGQSCQRRTVKRKA